MNVLFIIGEILAQKDNEKGHRYIAHTLYIPTSGVSIVPNKQKSFKGLLDLIALTDIAKFRANSFYININGVVNFSFLLTELVRLPIIAK